MQPRYSLKTDLRGIRQSPRGRSSPQPGPGASLGTSTEMLILNTSGWWGLVSETANNSSWKIFRGNLPTVHLQAQQRCEGCHSLFGEYYCGICHLFDRDKKQYHCAECGICRIGPKEDFFHCSKCNLCLSLSLRGKHKCIENVSRQDCPICLEDIHTSRVGAHVLPCGHLLHRTCYEDMLKEGYRCPLCMHSALDMTRYWRQLDDEVAQTPMPTEYQNMMVEILCNDCNARSTVQFHLLGMKCKNCESYNTAQDGRCRLPLEEQ
uniref:RING finger and CHY zinc finger domain-containing protein 1 n=1 Tax=Buteo japonicus TaxID=224669 RepID=A0A8C0BRF0_9AVES